MKKITFISLFLIIGFLQLNAQNIENKHMYLRDSLWYAILNYWNEGYKRGVLKATDPCKLKYLFECEFDSTGQIIKVSLPNNQYPSIDDTMYVNFLMKMPRYEKWRFLNQNHSDSITKILYRVNIRTQ